jgi:hypothetical protein
MRKSTQPVSSAILTLRDYLVEAERLVSEAEEALIARWVP